MSFRNILTLVVLVGLVGGYFLMNSLHDHDMHTSNEVTATQAYISEPVPNASAAAAYMSLFNGTEISDTLISVEGDFAAKIEIHTMSMDGDVMRMHKVAAPGLNVSPHEGVVLKPGGLHLMLMGLSRDLKAGEKVKLKLNFEQFGAVEVEADVLKRGEMPDADTDADTAHMEHH